MSSSSSPSHPGSYGGESISLADLAAPTQSAYSAAARALLKAQVAQMTFAEDHADSVLAEVRRLNYPVGGAALVAATGFAGAAVTAELAATAWSLSETNTGTIELRFSPDIEPGTVGHSVVPGLSPEFMALASLAFIALASRSTAFTVRNFVAKRVIDLTDKALLSKDAAEKQLAKDPAASALSEPARAAVAVGLINEALSSTAQKALDTPGLTGS